jgi:hypothetical protein
MSAVRSPPVYFSPDLLLLVRDKLNDEDISSETVRTPKSTPRFMLHLRCRFGSQTFHLLGFTVVKSTFVALIVSGRKKQIDLIFQIHDLLLSCGGLSEDAYKKHIGS